MNPMTQMLAQQRINDMHRAGSRSRVTQGQSPRVRHGGRTRRAQIGPAR